TLAPKREFEVVANQLVLFLLPRRGGQARDRDFFRQRAGAGRDVEVRPVGGRRVIRGDDVAERAVRLNYQLGLFGRLVLGILARGRSAEESRVAVRPEVHQHVGEQVNTFDATDALD